MDPSQFATSNRGKVAVVTGAGRGATLALIDVDVEALETTKAAAHNVQDRQSHVETYGLDITDPGAVQSTFKSIAATLGRVDILVNNAGITRLHLFAEEEGFDDFWRTVEVNFKGTMLCIHAVLPGMVEQKSGCIINMASRAATVDGPKSVGYNASKAALVRATGSLQEDLASMGLGEQVHTYCLHPGSVWGDILTGNTTAEQQEQLPPIFKDVPELAAGTVAYLSTGRGKALRGLYFDCRQDIERVASFGRETLQRAGLYSLATRFSCLDMRMNPDLSSAGRLLLYYSTLLLYYQLWSLDKSLPPAAGDDLPETPPTPEDARNAGHGSLGGEPTPTGPTSIRCAPSPAAPLELPDMSPQWVSGSREDWSPAGQQDGGSFVAS
ncbi:SDR family oxidoreductase [Aspergillus fumigatus Af293]|uniref:3-oxoacyl-(Acyl-carrier-protein) reductase n=2 Tax=Aspergillus fumigatus TaxID=746128 RepID=Q4WXH3_ASPFU|nr:3-oxoacyl-(acyl-carrier-protein) reductase [Aspergillus fumigatus Af293]EAL92630.1 3-oxoacyl-(acyl-carrier-protein) reductase [Aspergillus fumigatus Af293]EDP52797.1 3-oxoacyl-(acyl-carrier-protein) reductase [Aspergillus fumigatus A1163]